MQQKRSQFLWMTFGCLLCLIVLCFAGLLWFILGPWGPPLPWLTPTETTAAITPSPGRTTPTQPTPPRSTAGPTSRTRPTGEPAPTPSPQSDTGDNTAQRLAQTTLPPRDLIAITGRILNGGEIPARTAPVDDRPYTIGRQDRFWVSDPALDSYRQITATLRAITPHLYMYVEDEMSFNQRDLDEAARTFEDEIYPTNHQFFGSEWSPGVDGDPHLVILNAYFEGAAGYFSSLDEVPTQVNSRSNQHEMFYMNLDAFVIGSAPYFSTLAHEFQHMIHWNEDPRSDAWVDEGMAQMAEQLNGYDASDLAWYFLYDTDVQLTTWSDDVMPHYAASYLWFRYFTHRLGGSEVLSTLLDPSIDDITAIERALDQADYRPAVDAPRPFDAFFADWVIANYVNDPSLADGRYAYDAELEVDPAWETDWAGVLPWETSATVAPYGCDYIEVDSYEVGTLHIRFDGEEMLPLVDTSPHSGSYFWWSNRGDLSNSHLTRAFDLSEVDRATLRFWLWYDIEVDYDYVYIEVSTDRGHSWQLLEGDHSTDTNPNGNNLGYGYTGISGGGSPRWVQEEIDLSPFAGQEILLRFEMICDDALNNPGLALDDVEIPEIDFYDDMESAAGWNAQGFVWVDNQVPLHFLVQVLIEDSAGQITVQQLSLDANQSGELDLEDYGRHISRVVLAISAVAPVTTEPASYQLYLTID